ncbi:MAG: 2-amino-4-hydroxy-6-hydroxymethyldihydropteridine diphosphokinase [Bacteroidales bacterium]|nr:2-amino-4-hydroxy-6-hydroxymethyldihydropteridine diphosphokinase [Bacteroidales bacterium]
MKTAVLSLGTNLGNRSENLKTAIHYIVSEVGRVVRESSVIETESWGFDSFPFLNQALVVETGLTPEELLGSTQKIERKMGRTEKSSTNSDTGLPVYSDRIIDIDILLYGNEIVNSPDITVPHPKICEREFVLRPLAELFGDEVVAPFEVSFASMLEKPNHYGYTL